MKTLACPNCGGILSVDSERTFTCDFCDSIFQNESPKTAPGKLYMKDSLKDLTYKELIAKLPSYYKFKTLPQGGLSLTVPMLRTVNLILVPFSLVFALAFGGGGTVVFLQMLKELEFEGVLFSIPFLMVGVAAAYAFFYMLLNRTEIKLDREFFCKAVKPLPVPFLNKEVSATDISQFYCKKAVAYTQNDQAVYKYYLCMDCRSETISVISETGPNAIWALEILFERILGINDQAVDEEYN